MAARLTSLRTKGINVSEMHRIKTVIAPMGFINHIVIFGLAIYVALVLYTNQAASLHHAYFKAFPKANVICPVLSAYSASRKYNCEEFDYENFAKDERVKTGSDSEKTNTLTKEQKSNLLKKHYNQRNGTELRPNDFVSLFKSAKLIKEDDYEKVSDILEIERSGPEAWLAAMINDTHVTGDIKLPQMLLNGYAIDPTGLEADYGSIYAFVRLVQIAGFGLNNSASQEAELAKDAKQEAKSAGFEDLVWTSTTDTLVSDLTGYNDDENVKLGIDLRYNPFTFGKKISTSNAIKKAYNTFEPYDEVKGKRLNKFMLGNLRWYKDNSALYHQTIIDFGSFIVTEINSHPSVKPKRFAYQAFQGPIQFTIIALVIYIFFLLVWRLVSVFSNRTSSKKPGVLITPPMLFSGSTQEFDEAIPNSRKIVDHLITTLPLIGLFGTVIGILLGLPEVAAVLNNSGPNSSEATNELFVQLGLAFSTTALAVLGVIILELFWVLLQIYEDHQLWRATEKAHGESNPKTEDVEPQELGDVVQQEELQQPELEEREPEEPAKKKAETVESD